MDGPVRFFLPEGGVSALDAPGQPFWDPEADAALFARARTQRAPDQQSPACPRQTPHQRTRICIRHRQRAPSSGRTPGDPSESREVTMAKFERSAILKKFRAMAAKGEPIVGGGAGTGLSAKCEEAGGVDLIVIYNSGRYRMAGRGSLAGHDALWRRQRDRRGDGAAKCSRWSTRTPVLAGVNGTDPFRDMDLFLDQLKALGFCRRAELSDGRADRRRLPRQSRGDRHVLRARDRHDRQGARQGHADDALCVQRKPRRLRWRSPAPTSSSAISA